MLHGGIGEAFHQGLAQASGVSGVKLLARSNAAPDPKQTQGEAVVLATDVANFRQHPELAEEVFGPFAVLVFGAEPRGTRRSGARTRRSVDRDRSRHRP